jgi:hypothetical protein
MFKRLKTILLPVAILAAVLGGVSANAVTLPENRVGGYRHFDAVPRQAETAQVPESQQASALSCYDTASECSVAAKSPTAFRYVSEAEARVVQQSGFVPNVTQAGKAKNVFYSPEQFTSASAAEDALRIGGKNPLGPTATPTHRITVDASGANWNYGGSVQGGPGVELITTEQLPVLRIDPLGR